MKAKRFLSLLLTLALAVSLAVPALAIEETGEAADLLNRYEFIDQYIANNPAAEDFDDEAWYWEYEAWDLDYMTKEEYMEWLEISEEEFRAKMWQSYAWEMGLPIYEEAEAAYDAYVVEYYQTTHPGELESLSTDDLLTWMGYRETLTPVEQFMRDWDLNSEEEVRPTLLCAYATGRLNVEMTHADFLTYQEEYPEKWAEFDADTYFAEKYIASAWYGIDSKEEYMDDWNLFAEEEFTEAMFVEYVENNRWGWDNNWYDDNNWYWDGDDYDRIITLYANGELIDTDVTAAEGVTYADPAVLNEIMGTQFPDSDSISIRYAAESAGWDIVWNSYRREVVLLDRERLLTGVIVPGYGWVEEDVSGLDRLVEKAQTANPLEPGKSYRTTGTIDLTYTALNSLDGDETYTAQLKVETLTRDSVIEMSLSMDLADLLRLIPDVLLKEVRMELPKSVGDLKALLDGVKVDLIWNGDTGMLYVNAPIVALVDPTPGVDADTWYAFDLSELLEAETKTLNTAETLYQSLLENSETRWGGAGEAYSNFMVEKGLLHTLFGPHAVTEKSGALTWKLDEEMISAAVTSFMGAMGEPGDWENVSLFKECRLELTIGPKGETSLDLSIRPDMKGIASAIYDNSYYGYGYYSLLTGGLLGMADFRYAAKGQSSAKGSDMTLELHWKNSFKLALDMDTVRKEVNTAPRTTLPDGAEVVEI